MTKVHRRDVPGLAVFFVQGIASASKSIMFQAGGFSTYGNS
jgi:hypothetical protein